MSSPRPKKRVVIRRREYDYATEGRYFITICCHERQCLFGTIDGGNMLLSEAGQIAHDQFLEMSDLFRDVEVDVFQIMPNHVHAIITITGFEEGIGVTRVVGAYKSLVAKKYLTICKLSNIKMGRLWQRSFHDHIIRTDKSYQFISNYISNNPLLWEKDQFFI